MIITFSQRAISMSNEPWKTKLLDSWNARDDMHKFELVCMVHNVIDTRWQNIIPDWSRRNSFRIVAISQQWVPSLTPSTFFFFSSFLAFTWFFLQRRKRFPTFIPRACFQYRPRHLLGWIRKYSCRIFYSNSWRSEIAEIAIPPSAVQCCHSG
jgi:hypothetical protein